MTATDRGPRDTDKSPYGARTGGISRMSRRMSHLLRHGDLHGRYHRDPFRVAAALATEAARIGWDLEYLRAAIANPNNFGGIWYQRLVDERGERKANRELHRMFERQVARLQPAIAGATEARIVLGSIRQAAIAYPWLGRTANTQYRVFRAHLSVGLALGSLTYRASTRQLAESARLTRTVASKRSDDLRHMGLLQRIEPSSGTRGPMWRILEGPWKQQDDPVVPSSAGITTGSASHDSFRHGTGLDQRTWEALDPHDYTTDHQIAEALHSRLSTTRARLTRLAEHGLAERDGNQWRRTGTTADLNRIAEHSGTAWRGARQRQLHRQERAAHQERNHRRQDDQ